MNNKKKALRKQIFAQRRAIPTAYRISAQLAIVKHIQSLPCFKKARRFASFIATGSEVDVGSLACASNKHMYVPVISRYKTGEMRFAPVAQSFVRQQTMAR